MDGWMMSFTLTPLNEKRHARCNNYTVEFENRCREKWSSYLQLPPIGSLHPPPFFVFCM